METKSHIYVLSVILLVLIGSSTISSLGSNILLTASVSNAPNNRPTATVTSSSPNPGNTVVKQITIAFSKPVLGFNVGNISITGGTAGPSSGSGALYTFPVTPTGTKITIMVKVPGKAVRDTDGNFNLASDTLTLSHDAESPNVSLTSSGLGPSGVIPFTASFDEAVIGLASTSLLVSGGRVNGFTSFGSNIPNFSTMYLIQIVPTNPTSTVSVSIPANVAQDIAGNYNLASIPLVITPPPSVPVASCRYTPEGGSSRNMTAATFDACRTGCIGAQGTTHGVCSFKQDVSILVSN